MYYTTETKLSIQTQVKLLEVAEQELDRLLVRNKESELKRHFNNIEVSLDPIKIQNAKTDVQSQRRYGKIDQIVVRFDDILKSLDETMH